MGIEHSLIEGAYNAAKARSSGALMQSKMWTGLTKEITDLSKKKQAEIDDAKNKVIEDGKDLGAKEKANLIDILNGGKDRFLSHFSKKKQQEELARQDELALSTQNYVETLDFLDALKSGGFDSDGDGNIDMILSDQWKESPLGVDLMSLTNRDGDARLVTYTCPDGTDDCTQANKMGVYLHDQQKYEAYTKAAKDLTEKTAIIESIEALSDDDPNYDVDLLNKLKEEVMVHQQVVDAEDTKKFIPVENIQNLIKYKNNDAVLKLKQLTDKWNGVSSSLTADTTVTYESVRASIESDVRAHIVDIADEDGIMSLAKDKIIPGRQSSFYTDLLENMTGRTYRSLGVDLNNDGVITADETDNIKSTEFARKHGFDEFLAPDSDGGRLISDEELAKLDEHRSTVLKANDEYTKSLAADYVNQYKATQKTVVNNKGETVNNPHYMPGLDLNPKGENDPGIGQEEAIVIIEAMMNNKDYVEFFKDEITYYYTENIGKSFKKTAGDRFLYDQMDPNRTKNKPTKEDKEVTNITSDNIDTIDIN